MFKDDITSKWKTEAMARGDSTFSRMMADNAIEELKLKADVWKKTKTVLAYDPGVVKSDNIVPPELQKALKKAASSLEQVGEAHKDWHPGSDGKVLDLVHPSLFSLIY